jgi:hypothetical protein
MRTPRYEHDQSGMYEVPNGEWLRLSEVVELLESGKHVFQLDIAPNGKWKQRCRCGFYGAFNDHLIALIRGENKATS